MADDSGFTIHLTLTSEPAAARIPLQISKSVTSKQLRVQVSEATKIPLATLKVIVRGRLVADDDSSMVESFKLEEGSVLHCMGKPVKDEELPAPALVASTASTVSIGQPVAASVASSASTRVPSPSGSSLQAALATMRSLNSPTHYLTGVSTLDKILSNIASHPLEEKYRRVKVHNAAFQKRLGGLPGGDAVMKAVGFVVEPDAKDGEESYCLHASPAAWLNLMTCKVEVDQAVSAAKMATASLTTPPHPVPGLPAAAAFPPANAFPGWPAPGGGTNLPNMSDPVMQQAMAQIMSDPGQFQAMLQNPMVQNAMRSDPRFANDPAMLQGLESLASNPAMMNQLSQMMQNPAMQRQMQSMMSTTGAHANPGGGWNSQAFPGAGTANGATDNNGQVGAPAVSDEEMTEEEMIAEAIRRSLQDGS